jgi:opacity protein-like surface antigen
MHRFGIVALALVLMGAPSAARAAGPTADFTGAFLGLQTGYGFGSAGDWCFCSVVPVATDAAGGEGGAIAGVEAGYDWRLGIFVAELGARLSYADLAFSELCTGGLHCDGQLTWLGEAQIGAGIVLGDTLLAASAGLAAGTVYADVGSSPESSDMHSGVVYGVRVEQGLSDHWRFGIEYRFYEMEGTNDIESGATVSPVDIAWTSQVLGLVIRYEVGAK